jgi:hypothetical protein
VNRAPTKSVRARNQKPEPPEAGPAPAPDVSAPAKEKRGAALSELAGTEPELVKRIDQFLIDGASFEDVVETLVEQGEERVSLRAVENYFRSNLELQKQRVQHMVERFHELKRVLGDPNADPASADTRLAEAALFTGLMGLHRAGSLGVKDAVRGRLERENLALRNQFQRLQNRKVNQDIRIREARMRLDRERFRLVKKRTTDLHRRIESGEKAERLGPEAIQKIQEIYGLLSLPSVPADEATR